VILHNERIVNREDVRVDIEDRGYQFGDGIYEVLSVYQGEIFRLHDHLHRFAQGVSEIGMKLPFSLEILASNLQELVKMEQLVHGQVYFQMTRGYAPRNHTFSADAKPELTGYVMRKPRNLDAMKQGGTGVLLDDIRWLRCDIKSLSLLGSVLLKQKAAEQGAYECILHRNGIITEAGASNFYMVKDGVIWTHPINHLILAGVTRKVILEIAHELEMPVVEKPFTTEFLQSADEAFISGTVAEIVPIVKIDEAPVGPGTPGEITRKVQARYWDMIGVSH
jgi:D-alanine transaminase